MQVTVRIYKLGVGWFWEAQDPHDEDEKPIAQGATSFVSPAAAERDATRTVDILAKSELKFARL